MFKCEILSGNITPKHDLYSDIVAYKTFDGRNVTKKEIFQENIIVKFTNIAAGQWTAEIIKNRYHITNIKIHFEISSLNVDNYYIERCVDIVQYNKINDCPELGHSFLKKNTAEWKINFKNSYIKSPQEGNDTMKRIRNYVDDNHGKKICSF
jgi:hypothetical protein